jgi:hypothetical protein
MINPPQKRLLSARSCARYAAVLQNQASQLTGVAITAATSTKKLKHTVARKARSTLSKSFMARLHFARIHVQPN